MRLTFVSLGMIVYNELAKEIGAELDERGFVKTNAKGETNIENFYAVGDIQADTKKQIYTSWDMAVDSLDDINAKIRREFRAQRRVLRLRHLLHAARLGLWPPRNQPGKLVGTSFDWDCIMAAL